MKRLVLIAVTTAIMVGASVSTASAASFSCTSGGQAGPTLDPNNNYFVRTGGLIDYSCNKTWIAQGEVFRYNGGWAQYNPVHASYVSGHAHNCGNGVATSSDVFNCPSGDNSNFAADTGWYLTGPEWGYSTNNNMTSDMAVKWTIISVFTSESFIFYVCPDGDVHGGLPSGGCVT